MARVCQYSLNQNHIRVLPWPALEQHPTSLYPTIDWLYASEMRSCRCCKRWSHTLLNSANSILHDNFCLSMICSNNDVEKLCWYCLICYMNLNYTIFVDFFSLCKKYWTSNPCIVFCCWLVYVQYGSLDVTKLWKWCICRITIATNVRLCFFLVHYWYYDRCLYNC